MNSRFHLPSFLRPASCRDLIRLGRRGDGGYVVSARSVEAADSVLSLGVNDDWSFEEEFVGRRPVSLTCVDGSVSSNSFGTEARIEFARAAFSIVRGRFNAARAAVRAADERRKLHIRLNEFFDGASRRLVSDFVGPKEWQRLSWTDLRRWTSSRSFVKIDIEGAEYRILDELAASASDLTGLVVEFHDVDLMTAAVERLAERLSRDMCLVHVHANNCSAPVGGANLPPVLEVTWADRRLLAGAELQIEPSGCLPRPRIDQQNDSRFPDIELYW